jgi:hypothetical protein
MIDPDEHDNRLNEAVEEAFAAQAVGMDIDAAGALWRRLCSNVFTYQLNSGNTAAADAFAAMANEKLQREGVPFRVVRVPSA